MIVDDEVFNIVALKGLMKVLGFDQPDLVDACYNGEQAVELYQKAINEDCPDRYCLILTDCSMPFMDGYQASKRIKELNLPTGFPLKIVAITGHVEPAYIQKAHEHGIDEVFPKPMPILELGLILKEHGFISQIPPRLMLK